MPAWSLPEAIADILPAEARRIETLRRSLLDLFGGFGYELVMPPMLEYVESLLSGTGRDLDLQMFKLVDQMSGRTMGLRADITPQVARIDAHMLNRPGVTRLCYAGSVLYTRPRSLTGTREPFVVGAELYGHAGIEADFEIQELLLATLAAAGVGRARLDLGHAEILRAILAADPRGFMMADRVYPLLQSKARDGLADLAGDVSTATVDALLALSDLHGGIETLWQARERLPTLPRIIAALDVLERLAGALDPSRVSIDLADMRGYHYHSGTMFAAYCDGLPNAIAQGGRYDEVGLSFGRSRPATGFSLDLRELARIAVVDVACDPIIAPWGDDAAVRAAMARLRADGEVVVQQLAPGEAHPDAPRRLVVRGGAWIVETSSSMIASD
ncbi:MAG: ATP phosphoribosyltransferase regulatory subunit [Burkholderiaceae bacterium]